MPCDTNRASRHWPGHRLRCSLPRPSLSPRHPCRRHASRAKGPLDRTACHHVLARHPFLPPTMAEYYTPADGPESNSMGFSPPAGLDLRHGLVSLSHRNVTRRVLAHTLSGWAKLIRPFGTRSFRVLNQANL